MPSLGWKWVQTGADGNGLVRDLPGDADTSLAADAFFAAEAEDQAVTGVGFADDDAFGAATVTPTNAVTGAGFSDSDAFGAATVAANYSVTGAGFSDADAFGAATVATTYAVTGAGFSDTDTFGAAAVTTEYAVTGSGFEDGDAFGAAVVTNEQAVTGAGFENQNAFGAAIIVALPPVVIEVTAPGRILSSAAGGAAGPGPVAIRNGLRFLDLEGYGVKDPRKIEAAKIERARRVQALLLDGPF